MPRYPDPSRGLASIGGSVFSALADRLATFDGELYPFHVGDTWLEPAVGCRMQDLTVEQNPGMHRYAPPRGMPALLQSIARRAEASSGVPTTAGNVLIAAGATGALGATIGALTDPGDEVLILAPYWPLITGIVRCAHAVPVVVPFLGEVAEAEDVERVLAAYRSDRTVAVYVSSPNNPTGRVLPAAWLEALAGWAEREELWIVADDVYEQYVWSGEPTSIRALAPERTFAAASCSKAFGMAGNRCGWVVGPQRLMDTLCKVSTHTFYSCPTASQLAALRALDGPGDAWVADVRPRYEQLGREAASRLGVDPPEGSQFLWLDVADRLDESGLVGFLEQCADVGLFLAPGPSFGPYPTHVRLCYTACAPEITRRGVELLAGLIGRQSSP